MLVDVLDLTFRRELDRPQATDWRRGQEARGKEGSEATRITRIDGDAAAKRDHCTDVW